MNLLQATISGITSSDGISLVALNSPDAGPLSAVVIETPETADYLAVGKSVKVLFKETELSLYKGADPMISIQNRFRCKINSIRLGVVLAEVSLQCGGLELVSIVTANAVKQLQLIKGEEVIALIKSNELSIAPHD